MLLLRVTSNQIYIYVPVVDGDYDHLAPGGELVTAEFVSGPVLKVAVVDVKHDREQLRGRAFHLQKTKSCPFVSLKYR